MPLRRLLIIAVVSIGGIARGVCFAAGPYEHVLILSIDGMHESDLTDPATAAYLPNIEAFKNSSLHYSNAHTVVPSDSVPASLSYFTGAGPKTAGLYYEDSYDRSLYPNSASGGSPPGTELILTEVLDNNANILSGGGNSGSGSINQFALPQQLSGGTLARVYPHDLLKVNTVFEIAKAAGMRTAYIEKHPAYEMIGGPSGHGLDDFYAPESNAKVKLVNGAVVDSSKGVRVNKQLDLSQAYDDMRLFGLLNQISGFDAQRIEPAPTPAIYGMNFIALNTAQKDTSNLGGITLDGGGNEVVSAGTATALSHLDSSFAQVRNYLQANHQLNNTLIILTSHNGNSPRIGSAIDLPTDYFTTPLSSAGVGVRQVTSDDSGLIWLNDPAQTQQAVDAILAHDAASIDSILTGSALLAAGFGDPATDSRAPDLVVRFKPGILVGNNKRAEHGGDSEDDTHVPLLVGSDGLAAGLRGLTIDSSVLQTQIAVTTLLALGLDPSQLQGAVIDGTSALPTSVPEPAAVMLAGLGALLLGRRSSRSRDGR